MKGYKLNFIITIFLILILLLGLGIQFECIYTDYFLEKIRRKNSNIMNCFISYYQLRWLAQSLGMFGMLLSFFVLYKKSWKFPESKVDKFIIFSPILILVLDQIIVVKLL